MVYFYMGVYNRICKQGWPRLAKLYEGATIMSVISVSPFFLVPSVEMPESGVKTMRSLLAVVEVLP